MLRADAAPFWARLETTDAKDASGTQVYHVVMSDITDRKRVEEALQASQQAKYEQVVSMISDVVCRYEVDGQGPVCRLLYLAGCRSASGLAGGNDRQ